MAEIGYTLEDGSYATVHDGPLTCGEIDEIIANERRFNGVFRVPLSDLLGLDYDDALDKRADEAMFGGAPYYLEDWSYTVVGCEPGNILHIHISGWVVSFD